MNRNTQILLNAALLACVGLRAQTQPQTALEVRAVVQPGTVIGDCTFAPGTSIDSVAISDSGEWAFIARWPLSDGILNSAAIFTARRMVVSEGYQIDGKWITSIPKGAALAIDDKGRVAYEAEYADDIKDISQGPRHRGVFIDGHFALSLGDNAGHTDFTLTEEGYVVPRGYLRTFHSRTDPFPQFRKNVHGQFLVPVNLSPQGFLLLLASPAAH
jgi:hypothetical protein